MEHLLTYVAAERSRFRARLLRWYRVNHRSLPWRQTSDPYRIWVSEVMLQQTRVAAVLEHYRAFLDRFPDVSSLAAAPLAEVLAAWSGLGYYRRARSLHTAAREIAHHHGGVLPDNVKDLLLLPGFGPYTAAAVASIAFARPAAVLDGNVERVLRRLLGISDGNTKNLWNVAETLLSRRSPGNFNQAMMELGATVCLPGEPHCLVCPVTRWCATRGSLPNRRQPLRTSREIAVLLAQKKGSVLLVRRPESESVMPGLWELPPAARTHAAGGAEPVLVVRHAIMHTIYRVTVLKGQPPRHSGPEWDAKWIAEWIDAQQAFKLPLTGLARKILRRVLSPEAKD
jgi:A/G-specific adenine glycosylase